MVSGGPMTSDYGILSFSKLGVYIFGGFQPINMQDIYRFNEGKIRIRLNLFFSGRSQKWTVMNQCGRAT